MKVWTLKYDKEFYVDFEMVIILVIFTFQVIFKKV